MNDLMWSTGRDMWYNVTQIEKKGEKLWDLKFKSVDEPTLCVCVGTI